MATSKKPRPKAVPPATEEGPESAPCRRRWRATRPVLAPGRHETGEEFEASDEEVGLLPSVGAVVAVP